MGPKQERTPIQNLLRVLTVFTAVVVLLVAGLAIAVNLALLPKIVETLDRSLENTGDFSAEIGNLRYWPFYGIVARNLDTTGATGALSNTAVSTVRLLIGKIRIHAPEITAIRWIRRGDSAVLDIQKIGTEETLPGAATLFAATERVARSGLLPRRITISGLVFEARDRGKSLMDAKIARMKLVHHPDSSTVTISARESPAGTMSGELRVDYRRRTASADLHSKSVALTAAPFLGGTVSADLSAAVTDAAPVQLSGIVQMRQVSVEVSSVSDEPINNLDMRYDFKAVYSPGARTPLYPDLLRPTTDAAGKRQAPGAGPSTSNPAAAPSVIGTVNSTAPGELVITEGTLRVNDVTLDVKPSYLGISGEPAVLRLVVHLPRTEVQRIIDSVPLALSGKLANTEAAGTIVWDLDLRVPIEDIAGMQWTSDVKLDGFAVLKIDPAVDVFRLNGAFVHALLYDSGGPQRTVLIPPAKPASMEWMLEHSEHTEAQIERTREKNREIAASRPEVLPAGGTSASASKPRPTSGTDPGYRYVYVDEMSPWIISAVLTAEDGDFFFYGGINPVTFADAVALNFEERGIVVGASTISMQVVKILYLDQKRIFSRKIQEAFLVYLMEHQVPVSKERILELYLNLAEFGPGIYGVSDASALYFGKPPEELTAAEATWLASILPSPKTYYRELEEGQVSAESLHRMEALYRIMLERGRMNQEEYDEAAASAPVFARTR